MQTNFTLHGVTANGPKYAEAQLLLIEGNRLITRVIVDGISELQRRVIHRLTTGHRRQQPI